MFLAKVAGAARDGFMATVGHLLNRRGSAKGEDGDAVAVACSPAPPHAGGSAANRDVLAPMLSAGSVDLGAILRTCAQPLSPETLAYLRASGPPRSLLHDEDASESSSASSPVRGAPHASEAIPGAGLSPASATDNAEQRPPVQLRIEVSLNPEGLLDGRQHSPPPVQDGRLGSTELSWDGAGLHPLDGDDVSPFEMLLSAPEELAGGVSALACVFHGWRWPPTRR